MPPKASKSSTASKSPNSKSRDAFDALSKASNQVHTIIKGVKDFDEVNDLVGIIYDTKLPKGIQDAWISILIQTAHTKGIRTDSN